MISKITGITVGASETSKSCLGILNDLHDRGVKDMLFFCVNGLPEFKEALQNRQYRKVTKTKSIFPSATSLEKMLYLVSQNVTKK